MAAALTHLFYIFDCSFSSKMAVSIRQNLSFFIFKYASNKNVCSSVSLSISLHFFSTQTVNINPTVYGVLVHKHHFPCVFASRVASELSHVKNPETVDSILSFLKSSGFSNAQLQKVLNYRSRFLCYSLEDNIKPKIKSLREEGFSSGAISKIISSNPKILGMSLNNMIIPSLSVLKGLLGSNSAVVRVVRASPGLLRYNMEGTVVANVEFLKSIGVPMDRVRIILNSYALTFCQKPQVIRGCVEKAKQMGLTASSKAFLYAIPTIASMSSNSFELKLQAFRDVGFSDSDILRMFRKEPRVFSVSTEKMKKIIEGLVTTGRFDVSGIVEYPLSLMFSFEKRYTPRIRILKILERRNLIETWPRLTKLCILSDAVFIERFVSPHLDQLSDVDIPKLSAVDKVKIKP